MLGKQLRLVGAYQPIRVIVADDSVLDRRLVQELLAGFGDVEVVSTARNGQEAIDKVNQLNPDIVFVDTQMPQLCGIEVLRELRDRESNTRVVMLSSPVPGEAETTIDALFEGAFDFVMKPTFSGGPQQNIERLQHALRDRIRAYTCAERTAQSKSNGAQSNGANSNPSRTNPRSESGTSTITGCNAAVALGASTGGPSALRHLLPTLPADFQAPVLIAHAMPAPFTRALAEKLNDICELTVREAANGDVVMPGTVLLAPGGRHMEISDYGGQPRVRLADYLPVHGSRPAVDRLFKSVAEVFGQDSLGVVLSGISRDGTDGSRAIRTAGGRVLVQDDSAMVSEMPRSVIDSGIANRVAQVELLGVEIQAQIGEPIAELV
jgi:two-component system, chemotaxis family, protein-glutamate methylesterase/glutaminase